MDREQIRELVGEVARWARDNATDAYRYGSMGSYWSDALTAGIVTQDEYDAVRQAYARSWDYAGD